MLIVDSYFSLHRYIKAPFNPFNQMPPHQPHPFQQHHPHHHPQPQMGFDPNMVSSWDDDERKLREMGWVLI